MSIIITNISEGEGGRSMRISSPGCQHTYYFTATDLKHGVPVPHFGWNPLKILLTSEIREKNTGEESGPYHISRRRSASPQLDSWVNSATSKGFFNSSNAAKEKQERFLPLMVAVQRGHSAFPKMLCRAVSQGCMVQRSLTMPKSPPASVPWWSHSERLLVFQAEAT